MRVRSVTALVTGRPLNLCYGRAFYDFAVLPHVAPYNGLPQSPNLKDRNELAGSARTFTGDRTIRSLQPARMPDLQVTTHKATGWNRTSNLTGRSEECHLHSRPRSAMFINPSRVCPVRIALVSRSVNLYCRPDERDNCGGDNGKFDHTSRISKVPAPSHTATMRDNGRLVHTGLTRRFITHSHTTKLRHCLSLSDALRRISLSARQ